MEKRERCALASSVPCRLTLMDVIDPTETSGTRWTAQGRSRQDLADDLLSLPVLCHYWVVVLRTSMVTDWSYQPLPLGDSHVCTDP